MLLHGPCVPTAVEEVCRQYSGVQDSEMRWSENMVSACCNACRTSVELQAGLCQEPIARCAASASCNGEKAMLVEIQGIGRKLTALIEVELQAVDWPAGGLCAAPGAVAWQSRPGHPWQLEPSAASTEPLQPHHQGHPDLTKPESTLPQSLCHLGSAENVILGCEKPNLK